MSKTSMRPKKANGSSDHTPTFQNDPSRDLNSMTKNKAGARSIAVATGHSYSFEDLLACKPVTVLPDLAGTEAVHAHARKPMK